MLASACRGHAHLVAHDGHDASQPRLQPGLPSIAHQSSPPAHATTHQFTHQFTHSPPTHPRNLPSDQPCILMHSTTVPPPTHPHNHPHPTCLCARNSSCMLPISPKRFLGNDGGCGGVEVKMGDGVKGEDRWGLLHACTNRAHGLGSQRTRHHVTHTTPCYAHDTLLRARHLVTHTTHLVSCLREPRHQCLRRSRCTPFLTRINGQMSPIALVYSHSSTRIHTHHSLTHPLTHLPTHPHPRTHPPTHPPPSAGRRRTSTVSSPST